MGCGCGGNKRRPMAGTKVTPARDSGGTRALTASATGSWAVKQADGTMHPDGPFRSLLKAQRAAAGGGRVVPA